jgi:hypothetical protein
MPLKLNPVTSITFLDPDFVHLINNILRESNADVSGGAILSFHVSAQSKNHSLEISIDQQGNLKYFILFASSGTPPEAELVWDFSASRFFNFGIVGDLETGRPLLQLYCRNAAGLFNSGAYETSNTSIHPHKTIQKHP